MGLCDGAVCFMYDWNDRLSYWTQYADTLLRLSRYRCYLLLLLGEPDDSSEPWARALVVQVSIVRLPLGADLGNFNQIEIEVG